MQTEIKKNVGEGRGMSFFRYPGGKSKLRDQIAACLSSQSRFNGQPYREPFFGGGSIGLQYLQQHTDVKDIWINDKDIGIVCLWASVINHPDDFIKLVTEFTPSVSAFHEYKAFLLGLKAMPEDTQEIVNVGFKKLAIHQISYSGLGTKSGGPLGGEEQLSKYKINCRWSVKHITEKVKALNQKFASKKVECTNLDFEDVISKAEPDSLIYLDPPYYEKGMDLYQHGFDVATHTRLANALKHTKHSWVLSYDDCPEIKKLYAWAEWEVIKVKYSITATKDTDTGERASTEKPELLIYPKKEPEDGQCDFNQP